MITSNANVTSSSPSPLKNQLPPCPDAIGTTHKVGSFPPPTMYQVTCKANQPNHCAYYLTIGGRITTHPIPSPALARDEHSVYAAEKILTTLDVVPNRFNSIQFNSFHFNTMDKFCIPNTGPPYIPPVTLQSPRHINTHLSLSSELTNYFLNQVTNTTE